MVHLTLVLKKLRFHWRTLIQPYSHMYSHWCCTTVRSISMAIDCVECGILTLCKLITIFFPLNKSLVSRLYSFLFVKLMAVVEWHRNVFFFFFNFIIAYYKTWSFCHLYLLSFYLFIYFLFSLVYKSTRTNTEEETESIKEEDVVSYFAFLILFINIIIYFFSC